MSIQPPRIDILTAADRHFAQLLPGAEIFHAMLFPGQHPSDKELYTRVSQGEVRDPLEGLAYRCIKQLADSGIFVRRLVVQAPAGEFCNETQLRARKAILEATKAAGEETRVFGLSQALAGLRKACSPDSPYVQSYLACLRPDATGAWNPQASLWSARQRPTQDAIANEPPVYVGVMDYENEQFIGQDPWVGAALLTGVVANYAAEYMWPDIKDTLRSTPDSADVGWGVGAAVVGGVSACQTADTVLRRTNTHVATTQR